jgi:O-antigen/teichoic acid export membrane protein
VVEPAAPPADAAALGPAAGDDSGTGISVQVAKAGAGGLAGRTVLLLANLLATPFTIRLLGPSAYGLWVLIQAVFLWAGLAEGGMWAATTKYGAERYAGGDADGEATVVWSGLCIVLITTSSAALALALGAHFLLGVLNVHGSALMAGTWALRVACASFVTSSLASTVNTAQQVRLRWRQYTLLNTGANLLGTVGVPLAIYLFSGGLVAATAVGLLASSLYLLGLCWDAVRVQPALRRPRVDRPTVRQLLWYGGALTIANLAGVPLHTGERFFLSANASTSAVAYYAVAITIATTLQVLPEQLGFPLIPALARLEAQGRHDEHRALYGKSLAGLFLVVTPAAIVLALVSKPFLTLWAGPAYGAHSTVLLLVALGGVLASAFAWMPTAYMLSAGKTKTLAWLQGAELVPYLGAAWVLTHKWGALGAAEVWSGRLVLHSVAMFAVVRRSSHLPVVPLSARRIRSVVAPVLFGLTCLGAAVLSGSLLARSAMAAVLLAGYSAVVWWLVLTPEERRGVANLLSEMLGPRMRLTRRRQA